MWRWDWLEGIIRQNGWTSGAELGVFKGDTFLHLLRTCPQLTLIGVDLWAEQPGVAGQEDKLGRDFDGLLKSIRAQTANMGDRARIIQGHTLEVADHIEDGSLDFVFVDADHEASAVRADIMAWQSKLKPTGKMTGHDINWPSVLRVVSDIYPDFTIHSDNCWMQ